MSRFFRYRAPKYFFSFSRPNYFYLGRYRMLDADDRAPFNRGWSQGFGLFVLNCRWNAGREVASDGIHYPEARLIDVNGEAVFWQSPTISFEMVCALAGERRSASVIYTKGPPEKSTGTLIRGESVRIVPGMHFSAVVTGSA